MRIYLEGGYIEIIALFSDHSGKRRKIFRAVSDHTREAIECFSEVHARFFVRSIHEEYTIMMYGG